jgi:hypothetical protein
MELARSISELNKKSWYRRLKVAFVLSFVAAQVVGFLLVRSRTNGEVVAPISYRLIGRVLNEDMPPDRAMSDEQAGRYVYQANPGLWAEYVEKYEKKYVMDPIAKCREYTTIQRLQFNGMAFVLITLFFEVTRRAFYYIVFGTIFPRKRRRKRRKASAWAEERRE